jgi:hypothetical protein
MKLAKVNQVAPLISREGDRVSVTVTHNIKINGDDSWVKYEYESRVASDESVEDVDQRLIEHATSTVVQLAYKAAQKVLEAGK